LKWVCIGLLLTICIASLTGGFLLKHGFSFGQLSFGRTTVSNGYLVWNDKLELQLGTVVVDVEEHPGRHFLLPEITGEIVKAAGIASKIVSNFSIASLTVMGVDISVDFSQEERRTYRLKLSSQSTTLDALLGIDSEKVTAHIENLSDKQLGLNVSGEIRFDSSQKNISGSLLTDIKNSFPVEINFETGDQRISFNGTEAGAITDIRPLVDLFGLQKNITKWFTDYLTARRYHLVSFSGNYEFGNPLSLFHSFEAEIALDDVEYIFEPDLEPIYDDHPRAYFKNGVLDIQPTNPVFYGHDGGDSWVDINFNDFDNFVLTAHIKARTIADQGILNLLSYYSIDLPFLQVEGETESDLNMEIVLSTEEISGEGTFWIDEGTILYDGEEFGVNDTRFSLKDSEVLLEQINVSFEDIFVAHVTGKVLADKDVWDLDIDFEKLAFDLGESKLTLDMSMTPPDVRYHASPDGHFLETTESFWKLDATPLILGSLRAAVDLNRLSAQIPPVSLTMTSGIAAEISGYLSMRDKRADLLCDLLKYRVNDLRLEQPSIRLGVKYVDGLQIRTEDPAQWSLSNVPLTVYPSEMVYADNVLTTAASSFRYGNFFKSRLTGEFNMLTRQGTLYLSGIEVTHEGLATKLDVGEQTLVLVREKEGTFVIDFDELDLQIMTDQQNNWSAEFGDLSKIYERSELLRTYNIRSGSVSISSASGNKPFYFRADIVSPYSLLLEDGAIRNRLFISGSLTEEGVSAVINTNIHINYENNTLDIRSWDVGYDITEVKKLVDQLLPSNGDREENHQGINVRLIAEDSNIVLSPQTRLPADKIFLEYGGQGVTVSLEHGEGIIELERIGGISFFNGENLNDEFMTALLQGSYVQGGTLALAGMGTEDEVSAVIEVEETVLMNSKTLNNIMVLLNTIPALVTLSVPEYETKGLAIRSAVAGIQYSQGQVEVKSISVDSPVLQATGKGLIDLSQKTIDMDIQLTSQAGKNLRKIPVVGYVVAGKEEDTSATFTVSGSLENPEVKTSVMEEIVTMPIDILYRTLNLPIHLVKKIGTYTDDIDPAELEKRADLPENDR